MELIDYEFSFIKRRFPVWLGSLEKSHDIYPKTIQKKKIEANVNSKGNKWYKKTVSYIAPLDSTVNTGYLFNKCVGRTEQ